MSVKEQRTNMGSYASELDKLVNSMTNMANDIVKNIMSSTFNETIGNYLTAEENKIGEVASSLSDNIRGEFGRYLDFVIKSGKIYGYSFAIAIKNIGYIPRTLEDLLTRPTDQTTNREARNAIRYTSLLLYGMLPEEIRVRYAKRSLNSISETTLENLKDEIIYLRLYLSRLGAKEEEINKIVQLIEDLTKVPIVVTTQIYYALSKVFTPEVIGNILTSPSVIETMKELYDRFYDNVTKILRTESKKEVIETVKPEKEGVKEQEIESKKEVAEVTEQEKKNIKEQEMSKQEKEDKEKDDIEVKVIEKGSEN